MTDERGKEKPFLAGLWTGRAQCRLTMPSARAHAATVDVPETHYAKSGDLHIAYQRFGEGPREVILIPNWFTNVESSWELPAFARFYRALSMFARVVMLDPRGMGASDPAPAGTLPTLEEWVDDITVVLDAEGIERPAVIGLAPGAPIAIMFAATRPERTSALVLVNGSHHRTAGMAPDVKAQILEAVLQAWGTSESANLLAPTATEAERRALARQMRQVASPGQALTMGSMMMETDVGGALALIQVPTLVLHRTENKMVSVEQARFLAEHIPDAKLVELPGEDWFPAFGDSEQILHEVRAFITGRRAAPPGDRVLATVLFTDIVRSTDRLAELGDHRWREILAAHRDVVRRELEEFRGREIDTAGDGFLATFEGPGRAIRCAQAIRDATLPLGIEIRAGVHTGEIEMLGADVAGIAVHIGARVMALGGPGDVLVSSTVRDLVVGSGIEFEDRGLHSLKGVPGEWHLFSAHS